MKQIYIQEIDMYLKMYEDEYNGEDDSSYDFEDVLTEQEFEKYRAYVIKKSLENDKYFPCKINGDTNPSLLRFGITSHSKRPEGVLVRGPLVGKTFDLHHPRSRHDDDFDGNINTDFIKTKIINDRLISLLIDKELITEDEASKIKEVSREEIIAAKFDYSTF